jgi:hypothetical protein
MIILSRAHPQADAIRVPLSQFYASKVLDEQYAAVKKAVKLLAFRSNHMTHTALMVNTKQMML